MATFKKRYFILFFITLIFCVISWYMNTYISDINNKTQQTIRNEVIELQNNVNVAELEYKSLQAQLDAIEEDNRVLVSTVRMNNDIALLNKVLSEISSYQTQKDLDIFVERCRMQYGWFEGDDSYYILSYLSSFISIKKTCVKSISKDGIYCYYTVTTFKQGDFTINVLVEYTTDETSGIIDLKLYTYQSN